MASDRLPPIFLEFVKTAKQHQEIIPRIVLNIDYHRFRKESEKLQTFNSIDFYSNFWIECPQIGGAYFCNFDPDTFVLYVAMFSKSCRLVDRFETKVDEDSIKASKTFFSRERTAAFSFVMFVLGILTIRKDNKLKSTFTGTRNFASVFFAEGDTLVFKRIFDFKRLPSPEYKKPEPGASGIRKKEHEVIGHYRTYKSGVKVWVRPHKRGDPSLGTVTSVFT